MNRITSGVLLITAIGVLTLVFWKSDTPVSTIAPSMAKTDIRRSETDFSDIQESKVVVNKRNNVQTKKTKSNDKPAQGSGLSEDSGLSDPFQQFKDLSIAEMVTKLGEKLTEVERNALEQFLATSLDQSLGEMIEEMLDDGLMDLGLTGDEFEEGEETGYLEMATARLNSAIRVTGLKGNKAMDSKIIAIATSEGAEESTVRASYEALGYLGTSESNQFLNNALTTQTNPFLKSEIVLSLSTSGGISQSNVDKLLSYVSSQDVDLRNSAIVALGEAKEERAVSAFASVYSAVERSSKVLMVQALRKIGNSEADELLNKIGKSDPNLVSQEGAEL